MMKQSQEPISITILHSIPIGAILSISGEDRLYQVISRSGATYLLRVAPWHVLLWQRLQWQTRRVWSIVTIPLRNYYEDMKEIISHGTN